MSRRLTTGDELETVLRDLADRLRRLEQGRIVRLGDWYIEVDPTTADLVATYGPTGNTTIIANP